MNGFLFIFSPGTTLDKQLPRLTRELFLEHHYFFKCKCAICLNPPFSDSDVEKHALYKRALELAKMDLHRIRLLASGKLTTYEKDAIKFLDTHDCFHPVDGTMLVQHVLHMLWNTFASNRWSYAYWIRPFEKNIQNTTVINRTDNITE